MLETIRNFHLQFRYPFKIPEVSEQTFNSQSHIYLVGMGGSALQADMLNDYFSDSFQNFSVIRHYSIPKNIQKIDLIFCSSYSGNTEETLEAFDEICTRKIPVIVLTHGGELKRRALDKKIPLIEIPECVQPRCATGYFFGAILGVLEKLGFVSEQQESLDKLQDFLASVQNICEEKGRGLASHLVNFIPIIYSPDELKGVSKTWKIKFNENSKIQSFYNVYPELNHNEMVGFTKMLMKAVIIQLRSQFVHPRIGKRMDVMKELLSDRMPFHDIILRGENLLQEMFYAYLIADYTSYYLALAYGVDPAPVFMVEDFKKRLK
jgi:glucose/mannose-6-phosphate isomerase